jgi:N-acetylglucosaminyl-diphospho-decaprenol L-rhamnosyltransferase
MIYIAIISHGHEDLLISTQLCGLLPQAAQISIWLKDNQPSAVLKNYCTEHHIHYIDQQPGLGFGANNNLLFAQIKQQKGFSSGDIFLVLNPDVQTSPENILAFAKHMSDDAASIATINLFRDSAYRQPDANIRRFPDMFSPLRIPFIRAITEPYDKTGISNATEIDWASGAFLGFTPEHFAALRGFDEHYFMYFEDVDLCYRSARLTGKGVRYYPQLQAIHLAARKSRRIGSPHTVWFIQGFLKFIWRRYLFRPKHLGASL